MTKKIISSTSEYEEIDDETIILQIIYKDPNATNNFVQKYYSKLYGAIITQFPYFDHLECKSIIYESFDKAIKRFQTYDLNKGTLKNWLFQIAKNTARDRIRKLKRKNNPIDVKEEPLHKDLALLKAEGFVFTIQDIKDGLTELTQDENIILRAFLFEYENLEGLTSALAEKLQKSIGNIRVIKLRGKRKLIEFLKKRGKNESN